MPAQLKKYTLALTGNPNCGKSVIFNSLTGLHQHVANYPGVTIEQQSGKAKYKGYDLNLIDLPGTYGLTSYTDDETVTRDFLLKNRPDAVINIINATAFERSLYLTLQLLELGIPLLIVLNQSKTAREQGITIDTARLSALLSVPVVSAEATDGKGLDEIIPATVRLIADRAPAERTPYFSPPVYQQLDRIVQKLAGIPALPGGFPPLWLAIKLLEGDRSLAGQLPADLQKHLDESSRELSCTLGQKCGSLIAQDRYAYINGIIKKTYSVVEQGISRTEKIDRIVLHRYLGLPIFFLLMWLMFQLIFSLGAWPTAWLQSAVAALSGGIRSVFPDTLLRAFLTDGLLGGISSVAIFIPQIALVFIALSLLEDSGYMARAAFLMDEWMHRLGLHGRSFVPMILGFGCNVPAIMATRTLTTRREKILTCLIVPFMSCSARLPVYILLTSVFFPLRMQGTILFILYVLGILSAIMMARILGKYIAKKNTSDFILELPDYRTPSFKTVLTFVWIRVKHYILRAGKVIVAASVIVWAATTFPLSASSSGNLASTWAGKLGMLMEPLLRPMGFDWRIAIALMVGFYAKELVISTLGTLYLTGAATADLTTALSSAMTPRVAFALMIFVLLYTPCLATVTVIKQEIGKRWMTVSIILSLIWAYTASLIVATAGLLLGFR
ncbi:ferrous iron transport protein B [Candidatus Wirthbacteria bacterium CG2_30_54_11]|uniref:Ferrous iron transport protein B n=1 Tax=Candidatus Wirthbacteria bacterium CG2_30_54_11 TaxID=1817892 RepID=A0A1J5ILQ3_9BACT|nr:MAG: ferrous iron transport protein B [Candidatus Wirthbacteria bacterium CG2_30_54_11]